MLGRAGFVEKTKAGAGGDLSTLDFRIGLEGLELGVRFF